MGVCSGIKLHVSTTIRRKRMDKWMGDPGELEEEWHRTRSSISYLSSVCLCTNTLSRLFVQRFLRRRRRRFHRHGARACVRGACLMSNSTAPPVLILASISRLRAGLPTRHEGRRRARALRKPPPPLPPSDTQGRLRPTATGRPNSRQTDTERPKPRDHISAEEGWIEGMLHSTICYQPHISV